MNFQGGDILTRKNRSSEGDTTWISQRLIIQVCDISEKHLRTVCRDRYKSSVTPCHRHHNILPDTGKSWRWAKIKNEFYYDLNRIPNRKPTCYRDRFGDVDALHKNYEIAMKASFESNFDANFFYFIKNNYERYIHHYIEHTTVQRVALAKACAVLTYAIKYLNDNPDLKPNVVYKDICAAVARKDLRYIPKHYKKFRLKIKSIIKDGFDVEQIIKLPRYKNTSALVFDDPELISCAIKMRAMPQNYSGAYIARTIQNNLKLRGKKAPGLRWFGTNVFEQQKVKFLTDSERYGKGSRKAFENTGYIPMENALFAGDCWQIDATRVNLIEHTKHDKSKGFLFIIAVRDVHSGDIIGHSFDYSENRWSVVNAIKMAVENTGYLPFELVADRFPGHNTDEVKLLITHLKAMGVKITITHKATGKAHVERGFSTLQTVFMQDTKYYYGEGIQSRRAYAHRSPEYLKEIRKEANKEGFDLTDAYNEAEEIVEAYRTTKLSFYSRKHSSLDKSPMMLHNESDKPNVKELREHQISMLFGLKKKVSIKHNGQIKTEIQKAEYIYHIDDFDIYSNYKQVILSYDLNNLDKVHLFKPSGNLFIYLAEAQLFEKPQPYGPQAEFDKIAKAKQRLKDIEALKEKELTKLTTGTGANELDLMMGRFTHKQSAENAETVRILNDIENKPIKKAVGSDVNTSNSFDIDLDDLITNQL